MKKKKIIVTIVIIVAVGLLLAGGILLYQNYSNKNRIVTSFNDLKTSLTKTFNLDEKATNTSIKQTVTGSTKININPMFGNSSDGTDVIIGNLNNSTFNYEYRLDTESKRMYMDGSLLLNSTELLGLNFYQAEDISYAFLRNIFDKYIVIEDSDIFTYLEESKKATDDINYIYDKIIESLGSNITNDDIKVTNVDGKKKISLELNSKRLNEISKNIVNDLKKDDRAKKILGSSLDELDTSTSSSTTDNNNYLYYSIYLEKNDIVTYEFGVKDNTEDYSIEFNDGTEKSFVIKEGNTESLKATIEENNGTTTINLSSNNTNIGTVTISDNNISFNIIDESSNTSLNANITSATEGNVITTTFNMAISNSGVNIDLLTLTDTKTVTDGIADFSNINTTNNIDINSLTETDITNIQNNLMTILYNFMGITI
ncbi:MAG TPA: hypothetical protein IAB38_07400 [Candidatus Onthousia excrementipullorum]|uniref:Uncharacterized protein n=1 Tax=Candidatus Onthousia excrementipullorum TaxID=2840884 RepID=A0A9D1J3R7_9FIRM|nr:hypothetical protein [Candidatus Onthousia excrementipullorum]